MATACLYQIMLDNVSCISFGEGGALFSPKINLFHQIKFSSQRFRFLSIFLQTKYSIELCFDILSIENVMIGLNAGCK